MIIALRYRSFVQPLELLRLLQQRLLCTGLSPADAFVVQVVRLASHPSHLQLCPVTTFALAHSCHVCAYTLLQSRIMAMVKMWCQRFFVFGDFDDEEFSDAFFDVLEKLEGTQAMQRVAAALKGDLMSRIQHRESGMISVAGDPPPIIYPHDKFTAYYKFDKTFRLQMWPTEEVARQISLYEFSIFRKIQPKEMLNQAWSKKTRDQFAPNVTADIAHFNCISSLAAYSIVSVADLQQRQRMCVTPPIAPLPPATRLCTRVTPFCTRVTPCACLAGGSSLPCRCSASTTTAA